VTVFNVAVAAPTGWTTPTSCDQCPHGIDEHIVFEPDLEDKEDGWMFCGARQCDKKCWHAWSYRDGRPKS